MVHGIFAENEASLNVMFRRAMRIGAFAAAERIAFQLNEPGLLYNPSQARKGRFVKPVDGLDYSSAALSGGSSLGGPRPVVSCGRQIPRRPGCP